jgi:YD repeat-containing protein
MHLVIDCTDQCQTVICQQRMTPIYIGHIDRRVLEARNSLCQAVAGLLQELLHAIDARWQPIKCSENLCSWSRTLRYGEHYTARYDAWNRLVHLTIGGTTAAAMGYDGLGRRKALTVYGGTHHFFYSDQWQVVEERTASGRTERQFV